MTAGICQLLPEGIRLRAPQVHFIVAACENMIDGRATRPGDILTAANGKTVEVNNTDAEASRALQDLGSFCDPAFELRPLSP